MFGLKHAGNNFASMLKKVSRLPVIVLRSGRLGKVLGRIFKGTAFLRVYM